MLSAPLKMYKRYKTMRGHYIVPMHNCSLSKLETVNFECGIHLPTEDWLIFQLYSRIKCKQKARRKDSKDKEADNIMRQIDKWQWKQEVECAGVK